MALLGINREDKSESPFSDFDPFGVRQIMSVVSFRSSADVNAQQESDKNRGSRSRMALKNKVRSSSFAPYRDYWERASTSRCPGNNKESVWESPAVSDFSLSSCSMEFDEDDFDPEVETASTISDDGSLLGPPSTFSLQSRIKSDTREGCESKAGSTSRSPKVLQESIISLRLHRSHKNGPGAKTDVVRKPTSCNNAPKLVTHEFLLVRKKLSSARARDISQNEEDGPHIASKGASSFEVLPSSATDVTSPESFDTDGTSSKMECNSRVNDISSAQNTKKFSSDGTDKEKASRENDPRHEKYFRMLKVGLPLPAVMHACERDGVDGSFLQNDKPPIFSKGTGPKHQPDIDSQRRTRLHWDILPSVSKNSVWSLLDGEAAEFDNLLIDPAEFENLFREKIENNRTPDTKQNTGNNRLRSLIDPDREKNGSIVLSALRRDPVALAKGVDEMNDLKLDSEQISALSEYVPSEEEKIVLSPYFDGKIHLEHSRMSLCEKWMVAISSVQDAEEKLRSMQFMVDCPALLEELQLEANLLERACLTILSSVRLRKLLAIILSLGNRLNTAGGREDKAVAGIPLSALSQLEQVKAFDAKTSFLQYVVAVIQRNHPNMLLEIHSELDCVVLAERIQYDQWQEKIRTTEKHLESLKQIALSEARGKSRFDEEVLLLRVTKPGMFVVRSSRILDNLKDKGEELRRMFDDLNAYFAIPMTSPKKSSTEIIATIASLARSVERAREAGIKETAAKESLSKKRRHRRLVAKKDKNAIAGPKLEQMLQESNLFSP